MLSCKLTCMTSGAGSELEDMMIYEGQSVSDRKSGHMSGLVLEIIFIYAESIPCCTSCPLNNAWNSILL